ncbi:MAG: decarboxylating NADP(+)-dependent phosphogluconate dehydrogenase [Balneolaceae bacterium]|nr:MAG: decarboxylating NADP(+)-dependent phosphogluconate dehydrogenase [Balneolaceae bacterium]
MSKSHIGIYGLGVMGRNLALNFEEKGNRVSVYNRTIPGEETITNNFMDEAGADKDFFASENLESFVDSIERPRKIMMMVKAGAPVDSVIDELLPHLSEGDILIDGGNSNFKDTERRVKELSEKNILFVGMGVSGGEEGARNGPSMMPGGNQNAWNQTQSIFKTSSAKAFDGSPCCQWIGKGGAGHFVKMVHNGIEYADMQLIAEAYHLMKECAVMSASEISEQFSVWNKTVLNSYLMEISAEILTVTDEDGQPLVDTILDSAGQKGTGKWTAITSLELGIPLSGITEAVYSRFFSSLVDLRATLSASRKKSTDLVPDRDEFLKDLSEALQAARITAYAEGFYMITQAGREFGWEINPASVAKIWQGGCIIRSKLLEPIEAAYAENPELEHLLLYPQFSDKIDGLQPGWRNTIKTGIDARIPLPCLSAYLAQFDSLRSEKLPANLIQAQRDYFGAHTYERIDKPRGTFYHTNWQDNVK